jgi:hypothetical protein
VALRWSPAAIEGLAISGGLVVLRFGGVNEGAAAASVNDGLKARYPPEAAEAERCWFCCSNGSGMAVTRGCISKLWISGLGV